MRILLRLSLARARALESSQERWGRVRLHLLAAVRAGRVFVADGNQYFNRPGPRVVESLEILAELCHPAAFPARHADAYWAAGTHA